MDTIDAPPVDAVGPTPPAVEFFFDIGSPYSYLAAERVPPLVERTGVVVQWKPFLLGGLFKAIEHPIGVTDRRRRYMDADLARWSHQLEIPYRTPSVFPVNTILAQRALVAVQRDEPGKLAGFALELFRAFYRDDRDITMAEVVADVADGALLDGARVMMHTQDSEVKTLLRAQGDEALERGMFGAPTFFFKDQMFWGQDRLRFLEMAIREALPT